MDMNTQMRLTGLATGLDTDLIIQNLGRINTMRVDAVKRDKQMALWRQESFRDTISMINGFMRQNLNIASPANNFRSPSAFAKFSYNLTTNAMNSAGSNKMEPSSVVSITANGDLRNFNQSIQSVAQLASKDTWSGNSLNTHGVRSNGFSVGNFVTTDNAGVPDRVSSAIFSMSIDGVSRTINLDGMTIGSVYNKHVSEFNRVTDNAGIRDQFVRNGDGQMVSVEEFLGTSIDGLDDDAIAAELGSDVRRYIKNPDAHDSNGQLLSIEQREINATRAFVEALNSEIVRLYGNDYAGVARAEGTEIMFHKPASVVSIFDSLGMQQSLANLGIPGGGSSGNVQNRTIGDLLPVGNFFDNTSGGGTAKIERTININGTNIVISASDTIATLTSKINNSNANVELSYNTAGDRFTLTSKTEGTAANILDVTNDTALFFEMLGFGQAVEVERDVMNMTGQTVTQQGHKLVIGGVMTLADNERLVGTIDGARGSRSEGKNLVAMINNEVFVRQSNTFLHEGMTYSFNSTFNINIDADGNFRNADGSLKIANPADEIKINVGRNTSEIIDSIKNFVEEYNKIIDQINGLLTERRDRDFRPLSEDEKKAMKEEDIKAYEAKARQGMLSGDSDMRRLLDQMRTAIYTPVAGVGLTMSEIGITTSANWKEGGRLIINETRLNEMLENRYDEVVALFTKTSDIPASDMARRGQRTAEVGIAQRLNDVFNDAVRTTRDVNNNKGYLIEKAGTVNDASQFDNTINRQINKFDQRISLLMERWARQESTYYQMFARMETAMMKMQSQQTNLASIMASQGMQ